MALRAVTAVAPGRASAAGFLWPRRRRTDCRAHRARLARLLASWDAYARGIEPGRPLFMDARQLATQPTGTLTTREGDLDALASVNGVGDYARARAESVKMEAFGVRFWSLDLPGLIAAKRAANRPKDVEHLVELEALLALREQRRGKSSPP